jgi:hypothetical protein
MQTINPHVQRQLCVMQYDLMKRFHAHIVGMFGVPLTPDQAATLWMKHKGGKNPQRFREKFTQKFLA